MLEIQQLYNKIFEIIISNMQTLQQRRVNTKALWDVSFLRLVQIMKFMDYCMQICKIVIGIGKYRPDQLFILTLFKR